MPWAKPINEYYYTIRKKKRIKKYAFQYTREKKTLLYHWNALWLCSSGNLVSSPNKRKKKYNTISVHLIRFLLDTVRIENRHFFIFLFFNFLLSFLVIIVVDQIRFQNRFLIGNQRRNFVDGRR